MPDFYELQKKTKKMPSTGSKTADDALAKGVNGVYIQAGYSEEEVKHIPNEVKKEISQAAMDQIAAEGYFEQDPSTLDPETRREEIWRFRCMGLHKDVIIKMLGISRRMYYYDVNKHDDRMQHELVALGSGGILSRSYNYYDHLRDETMTRYNSLPEKASTSEAAMLLRLCKDIEDSKNKMILSVGAVQKNKPKMHEELVDENDVEVLPVDSVKNAVDDLLIRMRNGEFTLPAPEDK